VYAQLINSFVKVLFTVITFYFVLDTIKSIDSNENNPTKSQKRFELTRTEDIDTRLSDVKGIDEIRDEI
jgi:hypothetical protein